MTLPHDELCLQNFQAKNMNLKAKIPKHSSAALLYVHKSLFKSFTFTSKLAPMKQDNAYLEYYLDSADFGTSPFLGVGEWKRDDAAQVDPYLTYLGFHP